MPEHLRPSKLPWLRMVAIALACLAALPAPGIAADRPVVGLPVSVTLSPNQDDRPTGCVIDTIVVHDTKSPGVNDALGIARWFSKRSAGVSAHYVIGKAGEVIQCVPDEKRAWHAGPSHLGGRTRVNNFSIGIELVNDETGTDAFTEAQYEALIALSADLVTRHHIPLENIVGHRDVTDFPKERQDPADNFDWERFRTGLRAALSDTVVKRRVIEVKTSRPLEAPAG